MGSSPSYLFHYVCEDGLVYLCMADEEFGRRVPFAFLEDIKGRFKSTFGNRGKTAMAYAMNEEFSKVLKKQMVSLLLSFSCCSSFLLRFSFSFIWDSSWIFDFPLLSLFHRTFTPITPMLTS